MKSGLRAGFPRGGPEAPQNQTALVGREPLEDIIQFPALSRAVSHARSGSSGIYLVFRYLQGWSFHRLPAQPIAVLSHVSWEIFSLCTQGGFPLVPAMPATSRLFAAHLCCCLLHHHPAGRSSPPRWRKWLPQPLLVPYVLQPRPLMSKPTELRGQVLTGAGFCPTQHHCK